ncbi:MAG: metal-dependent hydrolase [Thermodesulfobacteriota bacterium]
MQLTRKEFLSSLCLSMAALGLPKLAFGGKQDSQKQPFQGKKEVQVEWLGHGSFKFTSPQGKVILLDPWISTNPKLPSEYRSFNGFDKVDLILFTHGHVDHFMLSDVKKLIAKYSPDVIAPWELSIFTKQEIPTAKCMTYQLSNVGGTHDYHGIKISMVTAEHSSGAQLTNFTGMNKFMGRAVGYILEFENGYKIYHSGDTGLMADMKYVVGDFYQPDLAILPIGGVFTMGPKEAAHACGMIRPSVVIPEHYSTFPVLEPDAKGFLTRMAEVNPQIQVLVAQPGEKILA